MPESEKTEIKIKVGEREEFILKGTVITEKGWTKYDDFSQKDKILPKLEKGDEVNTLFRPIEKETNPPKHYTIETLNNYLKNPFKEDKAAAAEAASSELMDLQLQFLTDKSHPLYFDDRKVFQ